MSGTESDTASPAGPYRVLARKYRPRDFSALIGQEPMVRTLTNAFETGRIAQAWMLTGVRGVGKTTTARILARALNYRTAETDRPTVDMPVPGEHCQAIMEGRHVDVFEMDAASRTGIYGIRGIVEQVRCAPVSARYKVYIVDEVHMLSTQAFNGLLKTLEEPPPHVKFIFATTEIRKVPITILSRCQRFDLRRVDPSVLSGHLRSIAAEEDVAIDEEALAMIARAAEGSVRDSLSIMDQAIAHGSGTVDAQTVRDMLGLADRARVIDLFELLMKGDVAGALAEFGAQYDAGAEPGTVLADLAEFNHLVTRLRFVASAAEDVSLTQEERRRGSEFAGTLSVRVLSRTWQMLLKGLSEVQSAHRPVSAAEMVLIRIAHAASLPTLDEALKSLEEGGSAPRETPLPASEAASPPPPAGPVGNGGSAAVSGHRLEPSRGGGAAMRLVEPSEQPEEARPAARPVVEEREPPPSVKIETVADIADLAGRHRDAMFKAQIKQFVRPVRIEPGRVEVRLVDDAPRGLLNDLGTKLQAWTGRRWIVLHSSEQGGPTLAEQETSQREAAIMDARSDPTVAAILSRFPGAKIIDVRIPDAPLDHDETDEAAAAAPVDPDDEDDS